MISTRNYSILPDRHKLQEIWKSISVIEAILSEDWLNRYYTYNSKWAESEEFGAMRNGQGDELLVLFRPDGCVINGLAHEYYSKDKSSLTKGLPKIYEDFIFGEPVNSIGTTFCVWTNEENTWQIGQLENHNDGSEELLKMFDGSSQTYIDWATDYYEIEVSPNAVSKIYQGTILTNEIIYSLDKGFKHWRQLKDDLNEINYPYKFE